jgi:ribosomal-protein-alanine N-acetyltransferase
MTTIRPMTSDDLGEVVALESANQPRPWSEQVFVDELAAPGRVYLVAVDDGLAGFGGLMVVGDEAHVTNLFVDPDRRRRGIGRALMVALAEAAVEAGARHLTLEVRKGNHAARSLYAGLGMAPVGVRPSYYGDDDALIMWVHDIDEPGFLEKLR